MFSIAIRRVRSFDIYVEQVKYTLCIWQYGLFRFVSRLSLHAEIIGVFTVEIEARAPLYNGQLCLEGRNSILGTFL